MSGVFCWNIVIDVFCDIEKNVFDVVVDVVNF